MNTTGDVDISPPVVVGGAGHSIPPEEPTSAPYVQVIKSKLPDDKITLHIMHFILKIY